ncbi:hypothetical protein M8C21_032815 [Ambrosia artemisiifolia]|uniref:Uncharacterized protein n=1 Tax=Ambrosia artemisiifolia TaxID=4212 RepID=A0AAD5CXP7_AMBAR|nr:hypothetical protein M8C21_032815 [Ambrosia artemisiifolia]
MNVLQLTTILQYPRIWTTTQLSNYNLIPSVSTLINLHSTRNTCRIMVKASSENRVPKSTDLFTQIKQLEAASEEEEEVHDDNDLVDIDWDKVEDEFSPKGRDEDMNYDKDPEFAQILGTSLDDPAKARSKIEERMKNKRDKIIQRKTGSATPMKVIFNKFEFNNSYIWIEFYHAPLDKDIKMICDLSQSTTDKRPSYDDILGANIEPTTFYNISDLEIQDNVARIWVDIGTSEPMLLDVLINAMTQISSDHVGIKQMVFGGSEYENWSPNLTSEDEGYSVHKI